MGWPSLPPRAAATGVAFAATLWASGAPAEPEQSPVRFATRVTAPAGCPDSDAFARAVAGRTSLAQHSHASEPDLLLELTVRADGARTRGALRMTFRDGQVSTREVVAANCESVTDALAFVAALAIDPNAVSEPSRVDETPEVEPEPDARAPVAGVDLPRPGGPSSEDDGVTPGDARASTSTWWLSVWLAGEIGSSSSAPRPLIARRAGARAGLGSPDALGADLELGVVRRVGDASADDAGRATLVLWGGHARACVRVPTGASSVARGCGGLEAGALVGTGWNVARPRQERVDWWAASLGVGLEMQLVLPLFALADAGVLVPLRRDEFVLRDAEGRDTLLYRPPAVALVGQLGLGLRLGP
ncbi:MAG: hypothetical protein KF718_01220 [Polyangiaceae bacterium]|nr:hypothetical protein [Polyangiaceae bacterium]